MMLQIVDQHLCFLGIKMIDDGGHHDGVRDMPAGIKHWITERLYNAEWALTTQLEVISRQFDEMEDQYLRDHRHSISHQHIGQRLHQGHQA